MELISTLVILCICNLNLAAPEDGRCPSNFQLIRVEKDGAG
jgi:hypothetical protein